tara:strand:- start:103 stop:576 length:474 start_codon:yes stop_codon:yes gene_type:complete
MFKGVVIIIAFLCFYPVVAPLLYKDDFTPVSRTNELLSDVNPDVIYYMHTRLDPRLNYEDGFINNISLANFTSAEDEKLNYKVISKVKENTYLIETEWPWLWGDSRYGYFVAHIDSGYLTLIDSYITKSISAPINSYKIDSDRLLMNIENKKIILFL